MFSPRLAEEKTGLRFTTKHEPGERATVGRFREQPYSYGKAVLEEPFTNETQSGLTKPEEWLVDELRPHIQELRSCGATSIDLDLNVTWQDQCNLTFDAQFLSKLGKLNIDLSLSCYEGVASKPTKDKDALA